ncbi:MAG: hypothetical protein ACRCU9_10645, partial [Iodobacter sp.]
FQLLNSNFSNLKIFSEGGFKALTKGHALAFILGISFVESVSKMGPFPDRVFDQAFDKLAKATERQKLAANILAKSESQIRHTPPESKGMLIYLLSRHGAADVAVNGLGVGDNYLPNQRKAVLKILRQAQTKSDLDNIIQHINRNGEKGNGATYQQELHNFFKLEAPNNTDLPFVDSSYDKQFEQLSDELILRDKAKGQKLSSLSAKDNQLSISGGDFNAWLDTTRTALNEEPVRGYSTYANDTHQYALQSQTQDHAMYACTGDAYYNLA